MTKEEILKIPASRKMDLLVADKVMQFPREIINANGFKKVYDGSYTQIVPEYSTDINAAWDVFLWLCERGICIISNGDGDSCDVDFIAYGQPVNDLKSAHITENSFPFAICLAALLATQ